MRILVCMLGIGGGGAERVLIDLLKYWGDCYKKSGEGINPSKDVDLFLIERNKKDVYYRWCEENLNKVFTFPHLLGTFRFLNKIWKRKVEKNPVLINRFIKEKYEINLGFLEGISTIFISQKSGGKKIGYIHTSLFEANKGIRKESEAEAYLQMDILVCVSFFVKQSLLKLYPELQSRQIEVIHNPIDKTSILEKSQAFKIQKEKFVFLQIGRIVREKGVDILLQASGILASRGFDFEVWFLGEGRRYQKKMLSFIKDSNLVEKVKFLGFHSNPYAYMQKCDVLVSASRFEGYGLVLAEACVLGKAIIASDIPTSQEILTNENGLPCAEFFMSENPQSLADAMQRMIENHSLKVEIEQRALEQSKNFGLEDYVKQIDKILLN